MTAALPLPSSDVPASVAEKLGSEARPLVGSHHQDHHRLRIVAEQVVGEEVEVVQLWKKEEWKPKETGTEFLPTEVPMMKMKRKRGKVWWKEGSS